MAYRYATDAQDYSDYSSGRVFYSQVGFPAFPVRLASEIYQRALARLKPDRPLSIYDPVCGGAYHLCAIGFLHGETVGTIFASDADESALDLARRNLALLSLRGLDRRQQAIQQLLEEYKKQSHLEALASVEVMRARLKTVLAGRTSIPAGVFAANVMDPQQISAGLSGVAIDLVLSDIPYGQLSGWQVPDGLNHSGQPPLRLALDALRAVIQPSTVVAIAADKSQKIAHEAYQSVEKFQVGKRQVRLLRLSG